MTAGRDPVDRVIDVLVGVPVSAAVATRRVLPLMARAGRRGLARLTERGGVVSPTSGADLSERRDAGRPAAALDVVDGSVVVDDAAHEPVDALPIDGYDHLAARQVCDRLSALTPLELERVAAYERAHRARRTVLGKIEQLTS